MRGPLSIPVIGWAWPIFQKFAFFSDLCGRYRSDLSFVASGLSPYFELMAPRGEEVRTGSLPSSELLAANLGSRPTDCAWAWSIR